MNNIIPIRSKAIKPISATSRAKNSVNNQKTAEFFEMQKKAQDMSDEILETLLKIIKYSSKDADRLRAMDMVLNRAWGKAPDEIAIHIDESIGIDYAAMTSLQRATLLSALAGIDE